MLEKLSRNFSAKFSKRCFHPVPRLSIEGRLGIEGEFRSFGFCHYLCLTSLSTPSLETRRSVRHETEFRVLKLEFSRTIVRRF
jgi:hypothetical protein